MERPSMTMESILEEASENISSIGGSGRTEKKKNAEAPGTLPHLGRSDKTQSVYIQASNAAKRDIPLNFRTSAAVGASTTTRPSSHKGLATSFSNNNNNLRAQLARVDSVHRRTQETEEQAKRVDSVIRRVQLMDDVVANLKELQDEYNNVDDVVMTQPPCGVSLLEQKSQPSSSLSSLHVSDPSSQQQQQQQQQGEASGNHRTMMMDSVILQTRQMDQELEALKAEATAERHRPRRVPTWSAASATTTTTHHDDSINKITNSSKAWMTLAMASLVALVLCLLVFPSAWWNVLIAALTRTGQSMLQALMVGAIGGITTIGILMMVANRKNRGSWNGSANTKRE